MHTTLYQETNDYEEEYFPNIPVNTEFPDVPDSFFARIIDDMKRRQLPTCHNRIYFGEDFKSSVPIRTNENSKLFELERTFIQWFQEKLWQLPITDTVPILQESPQATAESLMDKLRQENISLHGLGRILIKIRAGHFFSLLMVGDTVVIDPVEQTFSQHYPLFIDISLKTEPAPLDTCQVIIVTEIAPIKAAGDNVGADENIPSSPAALQDFDHDITTPTGPICCMYEELATVAGLNVTSAQYFYHGGYGGGISESS